MAKGIFFIPLGGFPPMIKKEDVQPVKKSLESRGFSSTNILKIQDILKK